MKPKLLAKKELSIFEGSSKCHGSLSVASDSLHNDLSANNLTSTVPSTTSAVIDGDGESCQDDIAIDTDNTDEEDLNEEDNSKRGVDETMLFQRIPSRVNPAPPLESLITLALQSSQHHDSTPRYGRVVPKSTSTDVRRARNLFSSMKVSSGESDETPIRTVEKPCEASTQSQNYVVRSLPQPIPLTRNGHNEAVVFSPRTTRHNMLATELTESLCRHLIWEKKEKTLIANAVLKRRHTYGDVTTLSQCPQRSHTAKHNSGFNACSWDQDLTWGDFAGYHSRGW